MQESSASQLKSLTCRQDDPASQQQRHFNKVLNDGSANSTALARLRDHRENAGESCDKDFLCTLAQFEDLVGGQQAAVTEAQVELTAKEAKAHEVDQAMGEVGAKVQQLKQRELDHEQNIMEKQRDEKAYDCKLRFAKLDHSIGGGALNVLHEWIDSVENNVITQRERNHERNMMEEEQHRKAWSCMLRMTNLDHSTMVNAGVDALNGLNAWIDLVEKNMSR
ncbi:hypothetical protein ACHAPU_009133 [Fusarium lateritium]